MRLDITPFTELIHTVPGPQGQPTVGLFIPLDIARQLRDRASITFVATDTGRSMPLADGSSRATVSASAADLVLLLYGRRSLGEVKVDGDRAAVEAFLLPIE